MYSTTSKTILVYYFKLRLDEKQDTDRSIDVGDTDRDPTENKTEISFELFQLGYSFQVHRITTKGKS